MLCYPVNKINEIIRFLNDSVGNYADILNWEYQRVEYKVVKACHP